MVSLHVKRKLIKKKALVTCLSALTLIGEIGQNVLENFVELVKLAPRPELATAFLL